MATPQSEPFTHAFLPAERENESFDVMPGRHPKNLHMPVPFERKFTPSGRHGRRTRGPVSVPTLGERVPPSPRTKSEKADTTMFQGASPEPLVEFIREQGFDVAQALAEGFNVLSEKRALDASDPDPVNRELRELHITQSQATRAKQFAGGLVRLFGATDEDAVDILKLIVDRTSRRDQAPAQDGHRDGHRKKK